MSGRTPGLASGESQTSFFNRLTLKPQLTNLLADFMAAIDDSFLRLPFMIYYFSLVESITENIFDGTPREKVANSCPIT
jgi:hypothetical protein